MEKLLIKGDWYTVTTKSTCSVTDAAGTPLGTAIAGSQLSFQATSDLITFSDPAAEVLCVPSPGIIRPAEPPQGNPLVCSWEDDDPPSGGDNLSAFRVYVEVPGVLESLYFYVTDNQRVAAEYCVDVSSRQSGVLLRAKVPLLFEDMGRSGYKCTIRFAQPIPVSLCDALDFEFYIKCPDYGFDDYTSLRVASSSYAIIAAKGSDNVARRGWALTRRTGDGNQSIYGARLTFMSLAYRTPLPVYWGFLLMPQEGTINGNYVNMPDGSGRFAIDAVEEGKYFYFSAYTQPLPLELMYKNITEFYPDFRIVILPAAVSLDGYAEM